MGEANGLCRAEEILSEWESDLLDEVQKAEPKPTEQDESDLNEETPLI